MTACILPLHEWKPWKVLAVGVSAGAALTLATTGLAVLVLRLVGVGS